MVTDLRAGSLNFPVFHFDNMAAQTKRAAARHPGYYVSKQPGGSVRQDGTDAQVLCCIKLSDTRRLRQTFFMWSVTLQISISFAFNLNS